MLQDGIDSSGKIMHNSTLYAAWLEKYGVTGLPTPDGDGYFRRTSQYCLLPMIRAYWAYPKADLPGERLGGQRGPTWEPETWRPLQDGWVRFLRADQVLDLIAFYASPTEKPHRFISQVRAALNGGTSKSGWLTPVDPPLLKWPDLLTRRVEALRIDERRDPKSGQKVLRWSRDSERFPLLMRYGSLRALLDQAEGLKGTIGQTQKELALCEHTAARETLADRLSGMLNLQNELRLRIKRILSAPGLHLDEQQLSDKECFEALLWEQIATNKLWDDSCGLDPVHTPETTRAGLSGYLALGWRITDQGTLEKCEDGAGFWGPSSHQIPHCLSNAPRRLMLGVALQAKAVPLHEPDVPHQTSQESKHVPPGRNLNAAFSVAEGYTHEDAFAVSETASRKLSRPPSDEYETRILIPSIASRVQTAAPGPVEPGSHLVRAYIDLFAIGWRRSDSEKLVDQLLKSLRLEDQSSESWKNDLNQGWLGIAVPGSQVGKSDKLSVIEVKERVLAHTFWSKEIVFRVRRENAHPNLQVGDKLATRHGIKGVVGRVVPDNQMPGGAEILLSPEGVLRRQAMGQFLEASAGKELLPLPASGPIFVVRQPQDAARSLGVCGRYRSEDAHPQRYGWMEFAALLAHGADAIALELLSVSRSYGSWMKWEWECRDGAERLSEWAAHCDSEVDHRPLVRQALNRYLSVLGVQVKQGRLELPRTHEGSLSVSSSAKGFRIPLYQTKKSGEVLEHLSSHEWWRQKQGLVMLDFSEHPISLTYGGSKATAEDEQTSEPTEPPSGGARKLKITLKTFPLLPPWLRPDANYEVHPLTRFYEELLKKSQLQPKWEKYGATLLRRGLELTFAAKDGGMEAFVLRDVLGRRLNRSARAVIVPDPTLRIDEIRIPKAVAETLFEGLADEQQRRVLVHRNPTLHRRSLLALKPKIDGSGSSVFGLPLGILSAMGADFDGDQVCVVALETKESVEVAETMAPGAQDDLRLDPFRSQDYPAFPLVHELAVADEESSLARLGTRELKAREWRNRFSAMVQNRIDALMADSEGWPESSRTAEAIKQWDKKDLEKGNTARRHDLYLEKFASENAREEWLHWARSEMAKVYGSVRAKGRLGGELRKQLYRLPYEHPETFRRAVEACQSVTERLTQSALDVKTGKGASRFNSKTFFDEPERHRDALLNLDPRFNAELLSKSLKGMEDPEGLLGLLQKPSLGTLIELIVKGDLQRRGPGGDPRIDWYL